MTHVLIAIIVISLLIIIHEFGHYICAKIVRVSAPTFSLGLGKRLCSVQAWGTDFRISLIPLGGFVEVRLDDAPLYKKLIVILGGPASSILAPALLLPPIAYLSGYDAIHAFTWYLGFIPIMFYSLGVWFGSLFTGWQGLQSVSGPVGITNLLSKQDGWKLLLSLSAQVSAGLGASQLLPIPFLDGGQALNAIWHSLRTRLGLSTSNNLLYRSIGIAIILLLFGIGMYNDLGRIMGGSYVVK